MTASPTSATGSGRVMGSVGAAAPSWTLSWSMQKPAAHAGALCVCSRRGLRHETCGPGHHYAGHHYGTQRTHRFAIAAVPGRSAALDVCVASSIAAAACGDAAQTAFDRKLSHKRNEIGELRQRGIHYRPRVWTADGRPHPAVTRLLQYAADIASSRNGQHQSAKSLRRRWKHAIPIALLQRRAAMARTDLPNPSERAEGLCPSP